MGCESLKRKAKKSEKGKNILTDFHFTYFPYPEGKRVRSDCATFIDALSILRHGAGRKKTKESAFSRPTKHLLGLGQVEIWISHANEDGLERGQRPWHP